MLKRLTTLISTFAIFLTASIAGPWAPVAEAGGGGFRPTTMPMTTAAAGSGVIAYNMPNLFGGQDVWLMSPDGSGNRRLALAPDILASAEAPVWSRDGKLLAITGLINGVGGLLQTPAKVLTVYDPAANRLAAYYPPTSIYSIYKAFSPDGRRIAYASLALNFADFGVRSLDGVENTALGSTNNTEGVSGMGIDWSPQDANTLVVSLADIDLTFTPHSVTKLFLVPAAPNGMANRVALTHPAPSSAFFETYDMFPAFSPDGTKVAYERYVIDNSSLFGPPTILSEIHIIKIDGTGDTTMIAFPQEQVNSISWSPDGTQLALTRVQAPYGVPGPELGVWIVGSNGVGLRQLAQAPAGNASWSWH